MNDTSISIEEADLSVRCLNCKHEWTINRIDVTLAAFYLDAKWDAALLTSVDSFAYYVVGFETRRDGSSIDMSCDSCSTRGADQLNARLRVRGEGSMSSPAMPTINYSRCIFAFPLLTLANDVQWRTHPDPTGAHFAVRQK